MVKPFLLKSQTIQEFKIIFMQQNIILGLLFFASLIACTPKMIIPYERTGAVEFYNGDKNTLSVYTNGYAENENKAIYYAERNALENILFRGIPGSNQENPMISNENDAYRKSKEILDALIINEGYRKFMIESYSTDSAKSSSGINVKRIVKFDIQAIRKYLEVNNVVRNFGF